MGNVGHTVRNVPFSGISSKFFGVSNNVFDLLFFCKRINSESRNGFFALLLQGALGQAGHVKQELVDGIVLISGRNICVTVNFLKQTGSGFALAMTPNGPAV